MAWTKYRPFCSGICLLQGVFDVQQSSGTNQVRKKQEHIAVLSGGQQISEMIVFLMYRKLKTMLGAENLQEQLQTPDVKK